MIDANRVSLGLMDAFERQDIVHGLSGGRQGVGLQCGGVWLEVFLSSLRDDGVRFSVVFVSLLVYILPKFGHVASRY
jgi:hypothetical protein